MYAYRKSISELYTRELRLPEPAAQGEATGQELCTLPDGRTIVVLFAGQTLPADQHAEIKASIEQLATPLPAELKDAIKAASPHVRLIGERVQERIRAKYSPEDESGMTRVGMKGALGGATLTDEQKAKMLAYDAHVEECLNWGRAERAKLGL